MTQVRKAPRTMKRMTMNMEQPREKNSNLLSLRCDPLELEDSGKFCAQNWKQKPNKILTQGRRKKGKGSFLYPATVCFLFNPAAQTQQANQNR